LRLRCYYHLASNETVILEFEMGNPDSPFTAPNPALVPLADWLRVLTAYVGSAEPDLTNRQMALLMLVYLDPGPHTVRGMAAKLHVSKPVVTRILNTLSALGYVRRQKDPSDLRNIFVERTDGGRGFLEAFAAIVAKGQEHRTGRAA
jgi:DNA-binding MarR family transcriptional regulator